MEVLVREDGVLVVVGTLPKLGTDLAGGAKCDAVLVLLRVGRLKQWSPLAPVNEVLFACFTAPQIYLGTHLEYLLQGSFILFLKEKLRGHLGHMPFPGDHRGV